MATTSRRGRSVTQVTLRRLARDFPAGAGNKGHTALILNPKEFGSLGDNWLGGRTYVTPRQAVEAAAKAGVQIVSMPVSQAVRVFRAAAKESA